MPVYVSLLRGINVGGNKMIKMADLRTLFESLGFSAVQTLLQSGNAVFSSPVGDPLALRQQIEAAIQARYGFSVDVFVLAVPEFLAAYANNPFADQPDLDPAKLLVTFLPAPMTADAITHLHATHTGPEIVRPIGSVLYVYFPEGMGRSKFADQPQSPLKTGTGRNWNTMTKLRAMVQPES
jgi:uncharacterized protein (DUF1697 family)